MLVATLYCGQVKTFAINLSHVLKVDLRRYGLGWLKEVEPEIKEKKLKNVFRILQVNFTI